MVQICCLLGTIPPLKAWSRGQGVGSQLAIGCGGRVKPDGPGQPHALLGGAGLAELTRAPVETTEARGVFVLESGVAEQSLLRMPAPTCTRRLLSLSLAAKKMKVPWQRTVLRPAS